MTTRTRTDRFRRWLAHAFATGDPAAADEAADHALLARVAAWIAARRLTAPAILFLESYRPLGYLGSQALAMTEPFVDMALGAFPGLSRHLSRRDYARFITLLEQRQTIATLLTHLRQQQ